jgi:hypothetical protein
LTALEDVWKEMDLRRAEKDIAEKAVISRIY